MKEKKTVLRWFDEELPNPIKENAKKYANYWGTGSIKTTSLFEALKQGFPWSTTNEEKNAADKEEPGYWLRIGNKYCKTKKNKK